MKFWRTLTRNKHRQDGRRPPIGPTDGGDRVTTCSAGSAVLEMQTGFFAIVELKKLKDEPLGIILSSTSDVGCPSIAALRPGSVAHKSDQLVPGDQLVSVNGINTSRMRQDEVTSLLDNVDEHALLELEYSMYNYNSQNSLCVNAKVANIPIDRVDGSLGITLRGGLQSDPSLNKPLVVTHVRPHGPAHRTGRLKVGDRILKVDNQPLTNKTLLEAQQLLRSAPPQKQCVLTVEYDVNQLDQVVRHARGPLLVEVERGDGGAENGAAATEHELGLVLSNCRDLGGDEIISAGVYVEAIVPASLADRCGALHVGDQILAVDDTVVEGDSSSATPSEVMRLLQRPGPGGYTRLQILPARATTGTRRRHHPQQDCWTHRGTTTPSSPSLSGFSTMASRRSKYRNRILRQSSMLKYYANDAGQSSQASSNFCGYSPQLGVCHVEALTVSLSPAGPSGYGLKVGIDNSTNDDEANVIVTHIANDSPAYRCGCLQVGDRILSVNYQNNLTLQEIDSLLEMGNSTSSAKLILQAEFDVADSIVPSSGIFTVRLARRGPGLGITITASKTQQDDPFTVSEVRRGSVAHRAGTLRVGDRLLAVDGRPLDRAAVDSGLLEHQGGSAGEIVTLRVQRVEHDQETEPPDVGYLDDLEENDLDEQVAYTVELTRNGGPLGVTISGNEDSTEPIVLSGLTQGGLAERTGALHVGDRILAINHQSLQRRPLSEAVRLLQLAGNHVQIRVARTLRPRNRTRTEEGSTDRTGVYKQTETSAGPARSHFPSPGLVSLESAAESWDSGVAADSAAGLPEDGTGEVGAPTTQPSQRAQPESASEYYGQGSQLHFYSDTEESVCPSPLPLPNYSFTNTLGSRYDSSYFGKAPEFKTEYEDSCSLDLNEMHHVILYKDTIYDDYGFSVSDGLYERGVYINRIRRGGPAHMAGSLKPYDRILQVNATKTQDFDCCLTVPLIASAGDKIELIISRNPYINYIDEKDLDMSWTPIDTELSGASPKPLSSSQNTITKTL